MQYKLITPPVKQPLTINEVRDHCRASRTTVTVDDPYISTLIDAAVGYAEHVTGRAIMTQTWEYIADCFSSELHLIKCPVQSITSIKYLDNAGAEQTLATSLYRVDLDSEPARITPAYAQTWPPTYSVNAAVRIRFVSGYTTADLVPRALRHAMLLLIAAWYENRESFIVGQGFTTQNIPIHAEKILLQDRVWS